MTLSIKSNLEKAGHAISKNLLILTVFVVNVVASVVTWRFNHEIFWLINRDFPLWLDDLMYIMSQLGNGMVAVTISLWFFLGNPRKGLIGLISLLVLLLLVHFLKRFFDMPRPAIVFDSLKVIGRVLRQHSFPSGHSATVWAMVTLLLFYTKKNMNRIVLLALGIIVSWARVYVGAHFPFDVAVGAVIGIASAVMSAMLVDSYRISWGWFKRPYIRVAVLSMIFFFGLYTALFYQRNTAFGIFTYIGALSAIGALPLSLFVLRSMVNFKLKK